MVLLGTFIFRGQTMAKDEVVQLVDEILGHGGPVHHPKHYNSHPSGVETVDVAEWLGFNIGSAFKYVMRRDDKQNAVQDLNKALWYLRREVEQKAWWRLRLQILMTPIWVLDKVDLIYENEDHPQVMAFYGSVADFLELKWWASRHELSFFLDELVSSTEDLLASYAVQIQ